MEIKSKEQEMKTSLIQRLLELWSAKTTASIEDTNTAKARVAPRRWMLWLVWVVVLFLLWLKRRARRD